MFNSPIFAPDYTPQFSGHETFPMRYGWLKKAYDAVDASQKAGTDHSIFNDASAIAHFGVGKNMVAALRHWATQCGIISQGSKGNTSSTTELGDKLFSESGLDSFMEKPPTLWLIHWQLTSNPKLTSWFWVFSHYPNPSFDREHIVTALEKVGIDRGWTRMATATIKRDVECLVRTYAAKPLTSQQTHEDAMESPLTELSLIKAIGKKDGFRMVRGPKNSLGDGVFTYAVAKFWESYSKTSSTISFEVLAHHPGSPGKVFLLSEDDLAERLTRIDRITNGTLSWSETAGLKQLVRTHMLSHQETLALIDHDYRAAEQGNVS
jgi:hypothetical protein